MSIMETPFPYIRLNSVKNLEISTSKRLVVFFEKPPPSENESGVTFMTPIHRGNSDLKGACQLSEFPIGLKKFS
ncbi:MAG: hypothetical protein Ct9H90mP25_5380 [Gammaproteobacteria bacterium]|nr:MAG: hypothetical protein Ct9H90mP25_5380 [Gammaproteobacteria bacterium]